MLIGELSRRTGVSARSLRYYEAQGLLEARRGANGYRAYAEEAVVTVQQIRSLLRAGLSTEVIRQVLPCARGDRPGFDWCAELREILGGELAEMDDRIEALRRSRGTLAGLLTGHPHSKAAAASLSAAATASGASGPGSPGV